MINLKNNLCVCLVFSIINLYNQKVLSAGTADGATTVPTSLLENKAFEKCEQYSKQIYGQSTDDLQCGHDVAELLGESDAQNTNPREFPHMAILGYLDGTQTRWICNGILISDEYILTAAHCAINRIGVLKRALIGDVNYDNSEDTAQPQELEIAEVISHPEFKYHYNDIALIRLGKKAALNSFAVPACLHWSPVISETAAIETGWGRTEDGEFHAHLQKVKVGIFNQNECNASYAPFITERKLNRGIVAETQICAGHRAEGVDICQSGGPLQIYKQDGFHCMYSIIGFSSFREGCSDNRIPTVYTLVFPYVKWIESIVWK